MMMKRTGKRWLLRIARLLLIMLVAFSVFFVWNPFRQHFHGIMGEVEIQSAVLKQKLQSSKRLEVTSVEEEGTLDAKTSVIIFGTVGSTTIRYRYTASIGIDLGKVIMIPDSDRIIFGIPEPEILNDGIEALEISKHNFFSKAIEKSTDALLSEQRIRCREQYLTEKQHSERTWNDTVSAFNETVCNWLDPYGERHYQFEFIRLNEMQAD